MISTLLGILFFGLGALLALAVFVPGLRPRWAATGLVCGPLGCLGIGLALMSSTAGRLYREVLTLQQRNWLFYLFIAGVGIAILGFIFDRRKARRTEMMKNLQMHLLTKER